MTTVSTLTRLERLEAALGDGGGGEGCPTCGGSARRAGVLVRCVPDGEALAERECATCPSCGREPALVRRYIGVDPDVV